MKARLIAGLLCVAVPAVLAGCNGTPSATALSDETDGPRRVRVFAADSVRVSRVVSSTGTLMAEEQVEMGAKVAGRLGEILVDLGSRVRKDQVLARIDPSDYLLGVEQAEAGLRQVRARLGLPFEGTSDQIEAEQTGLVRQAAAVVETARLTHDRMARLWEDRLVSQAELDLAVSQLTVAEARYQDAIEEIRNRQALLAQRRSELEIARQQMADTVLVSPLDGAVRERHATVGKYLAVGAAIVTLVRTDPLRLRLSIPEREAAAVRVGQPVRLTVEGDSATYSGRVARLSPAIAEANRTLLVEAEIPDKQGRLRPGSFAKAEIEVEAGQEVVRVPAASLVTFAGLDKVLIVAGGQAVEKRVRTGRRLGEHVEILEGVAVGDLVVMEPGNLVAGQPVEVVD